MSGQQPQRQQGLDLGRRQGLDGRQPLLDAGAGLLGQVLQQSWPSGRRLSGIRLAQLVGLHIVGLQHIDRHIDPTQPRIQPQTRHLV